MVCYVEVSLGHCFFCKIVDRVDWCLRPTGSWFQKRNRWCSSLIGMTIIDGYLPESFSTGRELWVPMQKACLFAGGIKRHRRSADDLRLKHLLIPCFFCILQYHTNLYSTSTIYIYNYIYIWYIHIYNCRVKGNQQTQLGRPLIFIFRCIRS